ncbi:MAG TPA: hypothetical protein VHS09_14535 [Polyangiaceae bacterium]|jgi:hypothetical protein|nr:hypothetical protein [Polyangiaceae bacterium]
MSIATNTSTRSHEADDAPRVIPTAPPGNETEVAASEPESLDDVLDNPYDNIACTD